MCNYLQKLIGTDKKNPIFSIFKDEKSKELLVFFGATFFEKVPADQNTPAFKLLLARLFIASVKRSVLVETFGVALTTIRRWSNALKSGDPYILIKALAGAGAPRKLTAEIKAFVKLRFREIYKTNHYNYSSIIRQEIKTVFQIDISSETLRPLFNELKKEKESHICDLVVNDALPEISQDTTSNRSLSSFDENELKIDNRKYSLSFQNTDEQFFPEIEGYAHHTGSLVFNPLLMKVKELLTTGKNFILQWIILTLLGIRNIEQSKHIDFGSLETMFGTMIPTLHNQRWKLTELAESNEVMNSLIKANSSLISVSSKTDFYYDPHTKHYTGIEKILKGWCGCKGKVGKALHMDFMHTVEGYPAYLEHCDNYDDLRKRFWGTIARFRTKTGIPEKAIITFIIDRAIFSMAVFKNIIVDERTHLITWEKGYQKNEWDKNLEIKTFELIRSRNRKNDTFIYSFSYLEKCWQKNENMRQIIIRATNHKKQTIEVSILTDDFERNADEIIVLMFSRWIQENDFKYLIKHFGINEIVSYQSISYKELQKYLEDKEILSGEFKAFQMQKSKIKTSLTKLLYSIHIGKDKIRSKKKQEEEREKMKQIEKLTLELKEIEKNMKEINRNESKLESLIEEDCRKLITNKKLFMDYIKIIARNIFYLALQPFKEEYDNFRDDHELFRSLSKCGGYITTNDNEIKVILNPTNNYPPKVKKIIDNYLKEINLSYMEFPDNSKRKFQIVLTKKESKLFAIPEEDNWGF